MPIAETRAKWSRTTESIIDTITRIIEDIAIIPTASTPNQLLWVDNTAAINGDGTINSPFNTIAAAVTYMESQQTTITPFTLMLQNATYVENIATTLNNLTIVFLVPNGNGLSLTWQPDASLAATTYLDISYIGAGDSTGNQVNTAKLDNLIIDIIDNSVPVSLNLKNVLIIDCNYANPVSNNPITFSGSNIDITFTTAQPNAQFININNSLINGDLDCALLSNLSNVALTGAIINANNLNNLSNVTLTAANINLVLGAARLINVIFLNVCTITTSTPPQNVSLDFNTNYYIINIPITLGPGLTKVLLSDVTP